MASFTAIDLTHLATLNTKNTTMNDTPCLYAGRRFVVEVSNIDPNNGHEHSDLADLEVHATRTATNQRARYFLQRGYWVEIYDNDTRALLAGPFDPDQTAPAYIV